MPQQNFCFRKALEAPRAVFRTPERLLTDPRLDREGKRKILKSWEKGERLLAAAQANHKAGGEHNLLQEVLRALESL